MSKLNKWTSLVNRRILGLVLIISLSLVGTILVINSDNVTYVKNQVADNSTVSVQETRLSQSADSDVTTDSQTNQNDAASSAKLDRDNQSPNTAQSMPVPSDTSVNNEPAHINASLSINGQHVGNLSVKDGTNHCDFLRQALNKGLINQLKLEYNSSFKSYGVYQINGQGDPNIVWWVYEVNEKSPPTGCSGRVVKNGDSINWKYLK